MCVCRVVLLGCSGILDFVNDGLEGGGVVDSQVGQNFAVNLDTGFVDQTHQLAVAEVLKTGGGVDTLDPKSAEIALFVFAVAVCVCQTFLPSVLGYGPYVAAATKVTAGKFQNFFTKNCSFKYNNNSSIIYLK